MSQLPGNSHRQQREEPRPVVPVVKGTVSTRKRPRGKRLAEMFFAGRADVVSEGVVLDVLLPAAQDTVVDMALTFVERLIYGDGGGRGGRRSSRRAPVTSGGTGSIGHTNYQQPFQGRPSNAPSGPMSMPARAGQDFADLILETRPEAEAVLNAMYDRMNEYKAVTVADYYGLCGRSADWTADKYGWDDISGTNIERVRGGGGYILNLPRPIVLD